MISPTFTIRCGIRLDAAERADFSRQVAPHHATFPDGETPILGAAAPDRELAGADIVFGQPDVASLMAAKNLRWVHLSSAGYTRYDNDAFRAFVRERGIAVTNSSAVFAEPCAQQAMAFILAAARVLPEALRDRSLPDSPEWRRLRRRHAVLGPDTTVLLLGYGAIARRLATLLAPYGVRILASRRKPEGDEGVRVVPPEEVSGALGEADHVVNILPASSSTIGFMDAAKFAAMKPGAFFHNIGRGDTVDQGALATALTSGTLAGAWLDVTSPEPLPEDHPLRAIPACHITPHTAGGHTDETAALVRHFTGNLRRFVAGEPLKDRVM